ncbi:hypothetical protein ACFLT4_03020 [Chloroflexota bacterium]
MASASELSSRSKDSPENPEYSGTKINRLRPYQREVALALLDSVFGREGLTFSVEIARQGGKNELSYQLELLLLTLYMAEMRNLVKCSPILRASAFFILRKLWGYKSYNPLG